jgi:hypothetical protein
MVIELLVSAVVIMFAVYIIVVFLKGSGMLK